MIGKIISGIFKLLLGLVSVVFAPLDSFIASNIPNLANAIGVINSLIDYITRFSGWVVDSLLIETYTIDLFLAYITFKLTAPIVFNSIKTAVKWYNSLKI